MLKETRNETFEDDRERAAGGWFGCLRWRRKRYHGHASDQPSASPCAHAVAGPHTLPNAWPDPISHSEPVTSARTHPRSITDTSASPYSEPLAHTGPQP